MDGVQIQNLYPLTPMQEGMLFHSFLDGENPAYHQQMSITLQGGVDVSSIEQSMNFLIAKHDVLRTVFMYEAVDQPLQVVLQQRRMTVHTEDLSHMPEQEKLSYVRRFEQEDRTRGFDLTSDLLMRVSVLKLEEERFVMIWSFHHIIMDGWCLGIILEDFLSAYQSFRLHQQPKAGTVYPYSRYIEWLMGQDKEKAHGYWRQLLADYEQQAVVPKQRQGEMGKEYRLSIHEHSFSEETSEKLERLASGQGVTLSTLVQTMWGVLLQKYNYSQDVVFGSVVSGRPASLVGVEQMVGLFINTIPVRVKSHSEQTFAGLLRSAQQQALASNEYSYFPLFEIQAETPLRGGLIQSLVVFENYPIDEAGLEHKFGSLGFDIADVSVFEQTSYDMNVMVTQGGSSLKLAFNYNEAVYDPSFVRRIAGHLQVIADAVLDRSDIALQDIEIATAEEREQLQTFNDTFRDYPRDVSYVTLFESAVETYGTRPALVFENQVLDYEELNRRANQLARRLIQEGTGRGHIVGIMVEPSLEMIVGLLAIGKAGGAFLPIDPEYPTERIQYFMQDSGAAALLTQEHLSSKAGFDGKTILLDDEQLYSGPDSNLPIVNGPRDLAYIIYTSGSTGLPKGVMIEHRAMINLCFWHNAEYNVTEEDRTAKYAGFSFDCSVWEIFPYLFAGAAIYMLHKDIRLDLERLNRYFEDNRITVTFLPTQFAEQFMKAENRSLRILLTAGDKLKHYIPRPYALVNNYGPTENAVITTFYYVNKQEDNIPIGEPVHNNRLYILDAHRKLLPPGVPGELCISGIGLARGYWNKPELTADKFVDNPYEHGEKMYRTGDLAYWLPDGNIQFLGRIDQQVKIRGHRIEIGEIESHLMQLDEIEDCVVIPHRDELDQITLVAYVVSRGTVDQRSIRRKLSEQIPAYMIPAVLMQLDRIPVTVNGKIDRRALPKPELETSDEWAGPQTGTETKLSVIWEEIVGVSRIGIHDNFFDIGGHSLHAVMLVTAVHQQLDTKVAIRDVFASPTIHEMALIIDRQSGESERFEQIPAADIASCYPMSASQKRLYVLHEAVGNGTGYHLPGALLVQGEVDSVKLEQAFLRLIQRHEILRTSFHLIEGEPVQVISSEPNFRLERDDRTGQFAEHEWKSVIRQELASWVAPFQLDRAPLLRVKLIKLADERYALLHDMHHIITDGTSNTIFIREFMQLYNNEQLPDPALQYKDYAVWQQKQLAQDGPLDQQLSYWLNRFQGEVPLLQLPTDYARPHQRSFSGGRVYSELGESLSAKLSSMAAEYGSTLFMVLLAAYYVLLGRHSGQRDLVVGTPVSGRTHAGMQGMLGMFVNTLALRGRLADSVSFSSLLQQVHEDTLQAFEHQSYPFEQLVQQLELVRDMSRNPLFDAMLVMQNMDAEPLAIANMAIEPVEAEFDAAKFDLTLIVTQSGNGLSFELEFSRDLFQQETIERWAMHYVQILQAVASDPHADIDSIDLLSAQEKHIILRQFNATDMIIEPKLLHQLFEEQSERTPDKTALHWGGRTISFAALNARANQLARYLRERGIVRNDIVGISTDRSIDVVVAILAVLKAGAAYLPLNPDNPRERLQYMLEDSQARWVLTNVEEYAEAWHTVSRIDLRDDKLYVGETGNLSVVNRHDDLAYVIYTSGSTGLPKGVMIEHRNVASTFQWRHSAYGLTAKDIALEIFPYAFDGFIAGCFTPLFAGAAVVLLTEDEAKDPFVLCRMAEQYRATHIECIASLYNGMLDCASGNQLETLRLVTMAGEKLTMHIVEKSRRLYPHIQLINEYGPTENSVTSSLHRVTPDDSVITIGKPNGNTKIYIVDERMNLQPIGVAGELCISGQGLARGYLNRPELTNEKFVDNPFQAGTRLYRTGDLARYLADGTIEYIGRIDHQVKIRGYRVELSEIAETLQQHAEVREAVVLDHQDEQGNTYLCAYFVTGLTLPREELRSFLSQRLPHYMVPAYFMPLEEIPLTANGKTDRHALPVPSRDSSARLSEYAEPSTLEEQTLAAIWETVLGARQVGAGDSFFELGGDSIKAIQVSSRLYKQGLAMEMKELFRTPVLRDFARTIKQVTRKAIQDVLTGEVPLTPIQSWFFDRQSTDAFHFNQAVILWRKERFDQAKLHAVLTRLTEHHDMLRAVFQLKGGRMVQHIRGTQGETFGFQVADVRSEVNPAAYMEQLVADTQASFDLSQGPLMKAVLLRAQEGDHLLLAVHHLVVDGVSWRILLEDFGTLYRQALMNEPLALQEKTFSYLEWSEAVRRYAGSKQLQQEQSYWERQSASESEPKDSQKKPEAVRRYGQAESKLMELPALYTERLIKNAHRAYGTDTQELLLAALSLAVKDWRGDDRLLVQLEGHGREAVIEEGLEISRTVGWFTSVYPVLLAASAANSVPDTIQSVKETVRRIPNRGIGYQMLKYGHEDRDVIRGRSNKVPEFSFNYLGQFDQDVQHELFGLSPLPLGPLVSPRMERHAALEFNGMVIDGKLSFSVVYDPGEYRAEAMERLLERYGHYLQLITDHCLRMAHTVKTPSDYGVTDLSMDEWKLIQSAAASRNSEIESVYRLSSMQEGLLFHEVKDNEADTDAYFEQMAFRLEGELDLSRYERSVQRLIDRHAIFRTAFVYEGLSRPYQVVLRRLQAVVHVHDLAHLDSEEQQHWLEQWKKDDRRSGFDLSGGPLVRMAVIRLNQEQHEVIWSHHHILMDGWCLATVFHELLAFYEADRNGKEVLLEPPAPYRSYIEWLEKQDREEASDYWRTYLSGVSEPVSLPQYKRKSEQSGYEQMTCTFTISEADTSRLQAIAVQSGVTLFAVIQSIWSVLLHRYNRTEDIVFGTVVSGRPPEIAGIEQMVGLFINTVPVRYRMTDQTFLELLEQGKQSAYSSLSYDYLSLAEIQNASSLKQHLFNHIIVFENVPSAEGFAAQDELKEKLGFAVADMNGYEQTSYDFDVTFGPGRELFVKFSYNRHAYDAATVKDLAEQLVKLTGQVALYPEKRIRELSLLSVEEQKRLVQLGSGAVVPVPSKLTIHSMIEEQAAAAPSRRAVRFGEETLSYGEINERANRFGRYLQSRGLKREELVAVLMDRSPRMLTTILGIWKAGGAYMPVDPQYPVARQLSLLQESGVRYVVSTSEIASGLADEAPAEWIKLDLEEAAISKHEGDNLLAEVTGAGLAYVIYTSGSTGKPKGTMIEHAGMLNHILAEIEELGLDGNTVLAQNANHCFDISVWQFFAALTVGGTTAIYPNELIMEPSRFTERIQRDGVTILETVPSYLHLMLDVIRENHYTLPELKFLMITGETAKPALVQRWFEQCPSIRMVNAYGPAEASDDITQFVMDCVPQTNHIPVGTPLRNIRIYIVDEELQLLPAGAVGEICVAGTAVGRGYWNDPTRTGQSFLEDPFCGEPGIRMYRTGDLGRWLPDGSIEFYGRQDYQVKIRGLRIELGEIEETLAQHAHVTEAAVLAIEDEHGAKSLCAYVVCEAKVSSQELKSYVAQRLPDYMVPAWIVFLPEMPLSPNGKIDRKALPKPQMMNESADRLKEPLTGLAQELAQIWKEVLGLAPFGREASFFELGGHSLKAMTLAAQIHRRLEADFSLRDVFRYPTLGEQADRIAKAALNEYETIEPAEASDYYPLSSAQRRMYIVSQMPGAETGYNIPQCTVIEGKLDPERVREALRQLVIRHESLRTSFHLIGGVPMQRIHTAEEAELQLNWQDWNGLYTPEQEAEAVHNNLAAFIRPFDLAEAPLMRASLIRCAEQRFILLLDLHHIVSDGVTSAILSSEFVKLYQGETLPALAIHYKDFAVWQQRQLMSQQANVQERYWLDRFASAIPQLQLPTDFPRPKVKSYEGGWIQIAADQAVSEQAKKRAAEMESTLFMYLLAAFHVLLAKYSGQDDIVIGSPVAGRHYAGLEDVCGMFINTLPMRSISSDDQTFRAFVDAVKHNALQAYENQDYPLEELVSKLGLAVDTSRNPLFDVVFVIQNIEEREMELGELKLQPYPIDNTTSKFDLTLLAYENDNDQRLEFSLEYCTRLYREQTAQQIADDYIRLLRTVSEEPDRPLGLLMLSGGYRSAQKLVERDIGFEL